MRLNFTEKTVTAVRKRKDYANKYSLLSSERILRGSSEATARPDLSFGDRDIA